MFYLWEGPSAKVCSSAKCCVLVFKASMLCYLGVHLPKYVHLFKAPILNSLGGPSAKVGLSAKLGVVVFKASIVNSLGGPSAKCCVLVFKASMLHLWGVHLPKGVCLPSVVYWYSRHLCSICGGPSAKEGLSAKFELIYISCFAS